MPVTCEVYAGPLDGLFFQLPSPFVIIFLSATQINDEQFSLNWTVAGKSGIATTPFIKHWAHDVIGQTGVWRYSPFPPEQFQPNQNYGPSTETD